jgi:hypothetical protein
MLLLLVSMLVGQVPEGTLDSENIVKARALATEQRFSWLEWSPEAFEGGGSRLPPPPVNG